MTDVLLPTWIIVGLIGLPLVAWVLRLKLRYLRLLPKREPAHRLATVLVGEEVVRVVILIFILAIGWLALARFPTGGVAIGYLLVGIEILVVFKSLLWLQYQRQLEHAARKPHPHTRMTDDASR